MGDRPIAGHSGPLHRFSEPDTRSYKRDDDAESRTKPPGDSVGSVPRRDHAREAAR